MTDAAPEPDALDPHAFLTAVWSKPRSGDDALRILFSLNAKYKSLSEGMAKLGRVYGQATEAGLRQVLAEELQSAGAERAYCEARMEAIRAYGPFSDPGAAEERDLLASIRDVGAAVAVVNAAQALIDAVRGLVAAYAASSTE